MTGSTDIQIRTLELLELTAARVGGVVSEMSFKFFIQFVSWTAIYCIFSNKRVGIPPLTTFDAISNGRKYINPSE